MRTRRRIAAFAGLLALTGCLDRSLVAPSANVLLVNAVLDASARDQYVILQATEGDILDAHAVTKAVVLLTLPDGRQLRAAEEVDSTRVRPRDSRAHITTVYHFSLDKLAFELVPGGTYRLDIATPDGRTVAGRTTIPDAAPRSLVAAAEPFDRARDTLFLSWTRVPGAGSYEVTTFLDAPNSYLPVSVFADTSFALSAFTRTHDGDRMITPSSSPTRVVVSAVDANYYDYYRRTSDPFAGTGLIVHLSGAEGVFGSIVPIVVRALTVL